MIDSQVWVTPESVSFLEKRRMRWICSSLRKKGEDSGEVKGRKEMVQGHSPKLTMQYRALSIILNVEAPENHRGWEV